MYNKDHNILNKLNQLENKVVQPSYTDCMELRSKIYCGLYICKVLLQKTGDVDKAVELYNNLNCSVYKHIDNNTVYDNIKSLPNLIPLSSNPDIYKTKYFNDGKYCIVINSESKLYNVIDTSTHKYMFDEWFIYISVVPPLNMIILYKDDSEYRFDFNLNKIK